jgi:hypothetical protein
MIPVTLKPNIPTTADIQCAIEVDEIQEMLFGDRGVEVLVKELMN